MGDSIDAPGSQKASEVTSVVNRKQVSNNCLVASSPKSFSQKSARHIFSFKHSTKGRGAASNAAMFLLKVAALETVRRFSRARCPFVWSGMQALQVLCCPPFKWIQRWAPFNGLVSVMEILSKPLLVLSVATALSDQAEANTSSDPINDPQSLTDSQASESHSELSCEQSALDTRILDEVPQRQSTTNCLHLLHAELENQGISLPERINEKEIHRFYVAANGDFSSLVSSVKNTIRWRETYSILSGQELEMWSNMVFWHGFDVNYRPCLIVRLGLACISLSSDERPRFAQVVVSQVEHGILHLVDPENPQIAVLLDFEGLSPLRFPMQLLRSCSAIFQDHFPNRLGFLLAIRLPPVVRVRAQTFIQVLKPLTQQKVKIEGEMYEKVLVDNFQTLPSYLGGTCKCRRCSNLDIFSNQSPRINECGHRERTADSISFEDTPSPHLSDLTPMHMSGGCDRVLRTVVIGILMFWVLIAFMAGVYDPESRPALLL